ncbi:UDP-glucosyltransferase 2-like [Hylaeus volcanicus]|uniref:UDP-glucosyltransferase 2-like n=1 Tax=Hylaeus volcanicus TaxID=313075 RepID=UPI0023B82926|nr:UDP-glucosyltransferase 2-like [Hylaeus volcanicus]
MVRGSIQCNVRAATVFVLVLLLFRQVSDVVGFGILGICPSASYSHQQPFQALMKALAARGHNVTVISTIPSKKPIRNYEDVDLSFTYRRNNCAGLRHMGAFALLHKNMRDANELCEEQLFSPPIASLISRNKTFDAVIIEQLWYQCYYALVRHYNSPVLIGFLSVGNLPYVMDSVGNPDDALLNPDMAYPFTNRMTIGERIWNVLYTTWTRIYYNHWHLPRAQKIVDKWTSDVSVRDMDRNFSLVILGNNHVFGYPKPLLPNVIEVHSLQIAEEHVALPKDIQEFLDSATHGAIYFSLGSNLQTHQLPVGPLDALRNAMSSIKQKVLWKDAGDATIRADNVKFVKWAPQQAVLAHPKVMAYVMQGGLQSLQEAVHYSVPVVAIPFFGDQLFNARKILDAGIGLALNIDTVTDESIVRAITDVVENKTYYNNIKAMSEIVKDELVKPMDRAIWNVEHVIKFSKSRHLRYHGRDISFVDYYGTIVVLILPLILLIWACYRIVRNLKRSIRERFGILVTDRSTYYVKSKFE